jgi:hypothetical protein
MGLISFILKTWDIFAICHPPAYGPQEASFRPITRLCRAALILYLKIFL